MAALNNFYRIRDHNFATRSFKCSTIVWELSKCSHHPIIHKQMVWRSAWIRQSNKLFPHMWIHCISRGIRFCPSPFTHTTPRSRHPPRSTLFELCTAATRTSHQISITSKCNPQKMMQLNGGFFSNSINHYFGVRSNTIYVWHNKDKRNTMTHPLRQWSYR